MDELSLKESFNLDDFEKIIEVRPSRTRHQSAHAGDPVAALAFANKFTGRCTSLCARECCLLPAWILIPLADRTTACPVLSMLMPC